MQRSIQQRYIIIFSTKQNTGIVTNNSAVCRIIIIMSNIQEDIFSVYYPTYILTKCVGLAGYNIKEQDNGRFMEKSTKYQVVSTIFYILFLALVSYSVIITNVVGAASVVLLMKIIYYERKCLIVGFFFCITTLNKLYNAQIVSILNGLYNIDQDLAKLGYKQKYNNLKIITIIYIIAFITPALHYLTIISNAGTVIQIMGYVIITVSVIIYAVNYITITLVFVYLLRGINDSLTQLFLSLPQNILLVNSQINNHKDIIKDLAEIHQRIITNLRAFNKCFSVQSLLMIAEHCCTVIACIVAAIYSTTHISVKTTDPVGLLFINLVNGLHIGTFVFVATLCRNEVSLKN